MIVLDLFETYSREIQALCDLGVKPQTAVLYSEMAKRVLQYEADGRGRMEAYEFTATDFGCDSRVVREAYRLMNIKIDDHADEQ